MRQYRLCAFGYLHSRTCVRILAYMSTEQISGLAERIHLARGGTSLRQVALAAGVSYSQVHRICKGMHDPRSETVARIAVGATPSWLMYGEGIGPVNPTADGTAKNTCGAPGESRADTRALSATNH
jgi:Helix-turn-helix